MTVLLGGAQDEDRGKSFLAAAKAGQLGFLQAHLQGGVSVGFFDEQGKTAAHHAAAAGHTEILSALRDHGADFERTGLDGKTPVLEAMSAGKTQAARYLLEEAGVNADAVDEKGHGIVWHAARHAVSVAKLNAPIWLAFRHANTVDTLDERNIPPVFHAAEWRSMEDFFLLLLAGADPHYHDPKTGTDLPGLVQKDGQSDFEIVLDAFLQLPKVPEDLSRITRAELIAENSHGKRLIDNPRLWRRMPEVIETLERQGEALPDRSELAQGGVIDYSPMVLAMINNQAESLNHCLASHGETLMPQDYRDPRFCEAAVEMGVLDSQMQPALWIGNADGLRKFHQELPETARQSISNYHQIRLQVDTASRNQGRGR